MKNIKDIINKYDKETLVKKLKKVVIIMISVGIILAGIGAGAGFAYIKSNINYSQVQSEKIALGKVPGEIVKTKKDISKETLSLTYKIKIKGTDNMLNEVEVDSKSGAIIDIEYSDFRHNSFNEKYDRD